MRAACCGHLPPLLMRKGGVRSLDLESACPLLLMDLESIPSNEFVLERGDRLLFYTDGVTECEDPEENMYEVGRLMEALQAGSAKAPGELLQSLAADVDRFARGRELSDDRTLLLMTVDG
jgi:sigma-B regulation protein RsbU (phosphoserine phosphatase)